MASFLLVHGAGGTAGAWQPVAAALADRGHRARAIDLPGNGADRTALSEVTLARYGATVADAVRELGGPALVCGHSMGGMAITQGAAALGTEVSDLVAGLVYIAAFLPVDGESLLDLTHRSEAGEDAVQAGLVVDGDPPVARMSDDVTREAVLHCCTPAQAAWALTVRGPQPVAPFGEPLVAGADPATVAGLRRAYVTCLRDRAIRPELQRFMLSRAGCDPVISIDTDHCPWASARGELVDALDSVAAAWAG